MNCSRIFIQNVKNFVLRFDFFAANATLRTRGETSHESIGCGIISLVMVGVFIGIFAQSIIDVLNKADVQATFNLDDNPESTEEISGVNFAVGIDHTTFDAIQGYFTFSLIVMTKSLQMTKPTTIPLTKCTRQIWTSYGQSIESYYDSMGIDNMYCVPSDANLTLYGYQGSDDETMVQFSISKCQNIPGGPICQSDDVIDQFFDGLGYVPIRLLFVNKVISPSNQVPVTMTVEKDIFVSFSKNLGTRGQITLGRYEILTDQSILPFVEIESQSGYYIQNFRTYTVGITPTDTTDKQSARNNNYVDINIRKSTLIYNVERVYEKIDDLLSYIGGLFSLIFFVVFFVLGSFNEYRFQLRVAESSFAYDQSGAKIGEKDMGYLTYIGYSIYDWLKMVGINLSWKKMQKIEDAREEANEQLDVCYLMKKIRYYDWCLSLLLQNSHKIASHLVKPITLQESRKNRKLIQYYDKVMQNKLTDTEINSNNRIEFLKIKNILPIEEKRKSKSKKKNDSDTFPQVSNQNIENTLQIKDDDSHGHTKKKKCCQQFLQEQFDSQDEQAEEILYTQYKKLVADTSPIAFYIKQKIPFYLKNCMYAKMTKKLSVSHHDLSRYKNEGKFIELEI